MYALALAGVLRSPPNDDSFPQIGDNGHYSRQGAFLAPFFVFCHPLIGRAYEDGEGPRGCIRSHTGANRLHSTPPSPNPPTAQTGSCFRRAISMATITD